MIVEIIPETKTTRGEGVFSYVVPEELKGKITVGTIMIIPFGQRKIRGIVAKIHPSRLRSAEAENSPVSPTASRGGKVPAYPAYRTGRRQAGKSQNYKLKSIISINDKFIIPEKYIKIAHWVAEYYLCSLGEAISLFLPPVIKRPRKKSEIRMSTRLAGDSPRRKSETNIKLNQLTNDQKFIFEKLAKNLTSDNKKPALIYGVTGSGKTEIYLHLAKKTIELGKNVILLVPEIILTPQNIERFEEVFAGEVCIMHSGLSRSERLQCWQDFYSGRKKIIVGPRSALLVPSENIGLIIVDEEQEESYKQEQNPRYDALALAEKITRETGALLILGSATPRIETFYKAKTDKYNLLILSGRYNLLTLPTAEIVDLRDEIKRENFSPISEKLHQALTRILKKKEQAISFLNRRGMSTFISCRDCGEVINCSRCDVPMVYHFDQNGDFFSCHHCDRKQTIPSKCPKCGSLRIKYFGAGVEKIEAEICRLFPKARLKRVDAKVLRTHTEYENFYQDFKNHKFDIVIGTQILAKGFDIPGVSLVGIVSADVGLHLPHFRASEKIFRLITQVSGRSGRRDKPGQTVIQTYWPNSTAIKFAAKHDFEGFYNEEIKRRLAKNYPPKTHIIRVLSEDRIQNTAKQQIERLAKELGGNQIEFIGPGVCFFQRLNNRFRYQILIKAKKLPDEKITNTYYKFSNLTWDVDAINLL